MWGELGRGLDKAGSTDRVGLMAKAIPGKQTCFISRSIYPLVAGLGGFKKKFFFNFVPFGFKPTPARMERSFWLDEKHEVPKKVWWYIPVSSTV